MRRPDKTDHPKPTQSMLGWWVYCPVGNHKMRPARVIREIKRGAKKGCLEVQEGAHQKMMSDMHLHWAPGRKHVVRPEECTRIPEEKLRRTREREAAGMNVCTGEHSAKPTGGDHGQTLS